MHSTITTIEVESIGISGYQLAAKGKENAL
jgi:hypothetical protein